MSWDPTSIVDDAHCILCGLVYRVCPARVTPLAELDIGVDAVLGLFSRKWRD